MRLMFELAPLEPLTLGRAVGFVWVLYVLFSPMLETLQRRRATAGMAVVGVGGSGGGPDPHTSPHRPNCRSELN